jgi:hypothetical protein
MRLNEFADQRSYTLPPEEMAAILELLQGIWHHYDLDDDGPSSTGCRSSRRTGEYCDGRVVTRPD